VTLTARDRKIVIFLVPVIVLAAYWFLLLKPKREEASKLGDELAKQEERLDTAEAELSRVGSAKANFARDYEAVVYLGKAIPTSVDMPSLIVQLSAAAEGTDIDFDRISTGERTEAAPAPPSSGSGGGSGGGSSGGSGTPAGAAAPGGAPAGTSFGQSAEKAGEAKQTSDQRNAQGGANAPQPGGSSGGGTRGAGSGVPGLDTVPLEFTFVGNFFHLTDFFHDVKRFVRAANGRIGVQGRLMTIDGFTLKGFPEVSAEMRATVYLSPLAQGVTGGAGPQGPATAPPGGATPSGSSPAPSQPPAGQPPTAAATR
jgi:hypothetical protein